MRTVGVSGDVSCREFYDDNYNSREVSIVKEHYKDLKRAIRKCQRNAIQFESKLYDELKFIKENLSHVYEIKEELPTNDVKKLMHIANNAKSGIRDYLIKIGLRSQHRRERRRKIIGITITTLGAVLIVFSILGLIPQTAFITMPVLKWISHSPATEEASYFELLVFIFTVGSALTGFGAYKTFKK